MCRLFALVSKKKVSASYWMFEAEVPFKIFSEREINRGPHDSGWGIGYLDNGVWKVFKEGKADVKKYHFENVRKIKSRIELIHLRWASVGSETTRNAHPLFLGKWIFAHNGTVDRKSLIKYLDESFRKKLKTETDSEVFFYLIMQYLDENKDILKAIKKTVGLVRKHPFTGMNFIMSDGKNVYAFRDVSKDVMKLVPYYVLHYLVMKDEIVVSSDPLTHGDWVGLGLGEMVVIDKGLKIKKMMI